MAVAAPAPAPSRSLAARRADPFPHFPVFGMFSAGLGTAAALMFVPEQFHLPWALTPSAVCLTVGLLLPLLTAAVRDFRAFFRSEHIMILGLVYWLMLDLLQGVNNPRGVQYESVTGAFVCIGLFACGIWAGSLWAFIPLPRMLQKAGSVRLRPSDVTLLIVVCFCIGTSHYLISVGFDFEKLIQYLGAPRFSAPWMTGRLGDWRSLQYHLTYLGQVVPTLTVVQAHLVGWQRGSTMIGVVCSIIVIAFQSSTGSRLEVGSILGAAIATWVLLQPRITRRMVIGFTAAILILFVWMQLMVVMRNHGLTRLFSGDDVEVGYSHIVVDDNFYRLTQVLDLIPEAHPYTYGGQIFYVLVRPIPRALWQGKPINSGFDFEAAIGAPGDYVGFSYSALGEFFVDYGFPMVLFGGLCYGLLAGMWNQLLTSGGGPARLMLFGLGLLAMFAGIRSQQALMVKSFTIVAWLAAYKLFVRDEHHTGSAGYSVQ